MLSTLPKIRDRRLPKRPSATRRAGGGKSDRTMTAAAAIKGIIRSCVALALCAAVAACGSGRSSSTAAAGGASALVAAESCMRGQGIDIPDVTQTSSAAAHAALQHTLASEPAVKLASAEKACKTLITRALPQGNGLTRAELERHLRGLELFASCMQSHREI